MLCSLVAMLFILIRPATYMTRHRVSKNITESFRLWVSLRITLVVHVKFSIIHIPGGWWDSDADVVSDSHLQIVSIYSLIFELQFCHLKLERFTYSDHTEMLKPSIEENTGTYCDVAEPGLVMQDVCCVVWNSQSQDWKYNLSWQGLAEIPSSKAWI